MGQREAVQAARLIAGHGLLPDTVHTSLLSRSVATAHLGLAWLPVRRSWRLNQRHYGALQELLMAELAGAGLDEPGFQGVEHPGQLQGPQGALQLAHRGHEATSSGQESGWAA